jgi:hypothetical protein
MIGRLFSIYEKLCNVWEIIYGKLYIYYPYFRNTMQIMCCEVLSPTFYYICLYLDYNKVCSSLGEVTHNIALENVEQI